MPLKSPKEKFKQMVFKKKGITEGFGPIYEKGKIVPKYKGLGPENEDDLKLKVMKKKIIPKKVIPKKKQPNIRNIKNLV